MTAHPLELVGGRGAVSLPDLVDPHRRSADERRDVGRDASRHEVIEILAERGPADVVLDVALPLALEPLHLVVERAHRTLAEHRERHTLTNRALRPSVLDERRLGVVQHVDEAGRDRQVRRVHFFASARAAEVANGGDAVALHGDVLHDAFGAAAVVHRPTADHEVVLRRLCAADGCREEDGGQAAGPDRTKSSHGCE